MANFFDSIHIETFISPSWVDLTSDARFSPSPKWNVGIMDNGPLSRIGDPGSFSFSLKNSIANSAGLNGYYSPGHANVLTGWGTGLLVRLRFVFEGVSHTKFYGTIEPDGITVSAGSKGPRTVKVSCHDFMSQMADHELKLLAFAENKKLEDVAALILANMTISPLSTSYGTGSDTFPFVFDSVGRSTKALGELYKAALSEWGFVYQDGAGTFITEGRSARTNTSNTEISTAISESGFWLREDGDYWLREDGDKWVRDEVETASFDNTALDGKTKTSYGANLANRIEGLSYPRRIDPAANVTLAALQTPFKIEAGETKTGYRMQYVDPDQNAISVTGRDMATPVAGTHYTATANEDGTGADLKANLTITGSSPAVAGRPAFGVNDVEYTLENTGITDLWIQTLIAVGKGVYIYEPVAVVYEDKGEGSSQEKHGVYTLKFDMKYQDDPTLVDSFSQLTLSYDKDPHTSIDKMTFSANRNSNNMYGFLQLKPGTRAEFKEDMNAIDGDYYIMGYDAEIVSGKLVNWSPILRDVGAVAGVNWVWDTSTWDVTTVWGIPT